MQTILDCDLFMNYSLWLTGSQYSQNISQQKLDKLPQKHSLEREAERPPCLEWERKAAVGPLAQKLWAWLCRLERYSKHHVLPQPKDQAQIRTPEM